MPAASVSTNNGAASSIVHVASGRNSLSHTLPNIRASVPSGSVIFSIASNKSPSELTIGEKSTVAAQFSIFSQIFENVVPRLFAMPHIFSMMRLPAPALSHAFLNPAARLPTAPEILPIEFRMISTDFCPAPPIQTSRIVSRTSAAKSRRFCHAVTILFRFFSPTLSHALKIGEKMLSSYSTPVIFALTSTSSNILR